jgi:hypothetical protein
MFDSLMKVGLKTLSLPDEAILFRNKSTGCLGEVHEGGEDLQWAVVSCHKKKKKKKKRKT